MLYMRIEKCGLVIDSSVLGVTMISSFLLFQKGDGVLANTQTI